MKDNATLTAINVFLHTVILSPAGEVRVCVQPDTNDTGLDNIDTSVWLSCRTQDFALWSTSGFSEGLDESIRVSGFSLARSSTRVYTTDYSTQRRSNIRISNFTYDDHGATVTCEDGHPTGQRRAILSVGMFECCGWV